MVTQPERAADRTSVPLARFTPEAVQQEWPVLARKRLETLLREIGDIEARKREAEQIVAALRAYGVPAGGLPQLPWGGAEPGTRSVGRPRHFRVQVTCDRCGKEHRRKGFYTATAPGVSVCTNEAACAERTARR